jgi:hypothetical protein
MAKYAQNGLRMHLLQSKISPTLALLRLRRSVHASGTQLSPYFINWDFYFNSFWEPWTIIWHLSHLVVNTFNRTYTCPLNYDVRVWHGKTCDFIIDRTIYWVWLFEVSVFERNFFFLRRNIRKTDGTFISVGAIHSVWPIPVRQSEVWQFLHFIECMWCVMEHWEAKLTYAMPYNMTINRKKTKSMVL